MLDKIRELREWADELEALWRAGAARLGLHVDPPTTAPGRPSDGGETAIVPMPPELPSAQPVAPPTTDSVYTGPTDEEMWEPPAAPPSTPPSSIEAMVALAAIESGAIYPAVLEAIERWETGHYKSKLWLLANNPGGIKYRENLPGLAGEPYVGKGGIKYMRYASQLEGIRAHARFFLQPRYKAAREATDPIAQVLAIHEAGYAEKSPEWLEGVTALTRKALGAAKPTTPADLPAKIRAAALALPDPFPYEPETEGGDLGCANVVSYALIQAGALEKIEVAVRFLAAELKRRGWAVTEGPFQDGDVVVWGPRPGGVHGHIGILIKEGADIMTVQNSSSRRKVIHTPLATYDRPLVEVLRAPGGQHV